MQIDSHELLPCVLCSSGASFVVDVRHPQHPPGAHEERGPAPSSHQRPFSYWWAILGLNLIAELTGSTGQEETIAALNCGDTRYDYCLGDVDTTGHVLPRLLHVVARGRDSDMARRRGFGAIRKLPSGRWQASYVGPDTIRQTPPVTFETAEDAEGWLTDRRREIKNEDWTPPTTQTAGHVRGARRALAHESQAEAAHPLPLPEAARREDSARRSRTWRSST